MDFVIPVAAFVAVGHPATYKTTSKFLGNWVASSDGVPKVGGLILHALVFLFVIGLLYALFRPRKSGFSVFGMEVPTAAQGVSTYMNPYGWGKGHETHQGDLGGGVSHDDEGSPLNGLKGSPLVGVAQITNA
jgi:hypothetical protein